MDNQVIRADRLFPGGGDAPLADHLVRIADGVIRDVSPFTPDAANGGPVLHVPVCAPGFIDLQINGAGGVFFNETPDQPALARMAAAAAAGGTCHILPTFITAPGTDYERAMMAVADCGLPHVLGLHLEGPFLSPERPGIHPPTAIRPLTNADVDLILAHHDSVSGGDARRLLVTLAPEQTDMTLLARLTGAGVIIFAGHSNATTAQLGPAIDRGLCGVTHLFNACSQMTAREPGIVGTALGDQRLFAGIIADGWHVDPRMLAIAAQLMGDRLCLVSDAMSTFGSDLTGFSIGGRDIHLVDKRLQAADGTLAGAHLGLDEAVAAMCGLAGVALADALHMASGVPARVLGMDDRYGRIEPGRPASLTCLSDDLESLAVFVHGIAIVKPRYGPPGTQAARG